MTVHYVTRHGRKITVETLKPEPASRGFVKLTWTQVERLHRASRFASTAKVFHLLLFCAFKAYNKPFVLPGNAFSPEGVSRSSQWRAIRELQRLGLISIDKKTKRVLVVAARDVSQWEH